METNNNANKKFDNDNAASDISRPRYERPTLLKVPVPGAEGANPAQLCSSGSLAAQLLRMQGNCKSGAADNIHCMAGLAPHRKCSSGGSNF